MTKYAARISDYTEKANRLLCFLSIIDQEPK